MAFLAAHPGDDVDLVTTLLHGDEIVFPPVVLSEIVSAPNLEARVEGMIVKIPLLEITSGYWDRAGRLRARMISVGWNVSLADTLIAQCCLDHGVTLVTRDKGFKPFERHAGLRLR